MARTMLTRRSFLAGAACATGLACGRPAAEQRETEAAGMTHRERIDRVLDGQETDRPPYTFWYHFGLEKEGARTHADATLDFHRRFRTDLVKVMSDFPYPRPAGKWHDLNPVANPFPEQVKALEIIRDGLDGRVYFIETLFNPWNVAEKLSSKEEVQRLKKENPKALLNALEAIARSEANHARLAVERGASGVFLAIANAQPEVLSPAEYAQFSEPFDKMVLEGAGDARLNVLHLHGDHVYLDRFYSGWPASVIHYSTHGTGVPFTQARQQYYGVLMGGIDERNFPDLSAAEMERQWHKAQDAAGRRFILAPGCSVPDQTPDQDLQRFVSVVKEESA